MVHFMVVKDTHTVNSQKNRTKEKGKNLAYNNQCKSS